MADRGKCSGFRCGRQLDSFSSRGGRCGECHIAHVAEKERERKAKLPGGVGMREDLDEAEVTS